MDEFKIFSVAEVANRLNVRSETVLRWIHSGRLTAMLLEGGHYRISEVELEKLIKPVNRSATGGEVGR